MKMTTSNFNIDSEGYPITNQKKTVYRKFPAILNGHKTTAYRHNNMWLVGGDLVSNGDIVSIARPSKRHDNRMAWFTLHGCFLKFDDFVTEGEI